MASIPRERAKFMADRMAKASAIRGDDTCSAVIECCDSETRSSTIQPSPSALVVEFQPASVKTYRDPDLQGFGSILINSFGGGSLDRAEPTSILYPLRLVFEGFLLL